MISSHSGLLVFKDTKYACKDDVSVYSHKSCFYLIFEQLHGIGSDEHLKVNEEHQQATDVQEQTSNLRVLKIAEDRQMIQRVSGNSVPPPLQLQETVIRRDTTNSSLLNTDKHSVLQQV